MKDFYLNVAMNKLGKRTTDLNGWELGKSWLADKVTDNQHEGETLIRET